VAKFGVFFNAFATAATAKTAVALNANAAGEHGELVEAVMTGSGTAASADRQHRAQIAPCTFATAGTPVSSPTPEPFDQYANAAKVLAGIEFSAEPTVVGSVFPVLFGFNQRGGMRWAVPRGEGIHFDNAPTNKGLVLQVLSDAAGEVDGCVHWWEP
jgi:hypothetical protein